MRVIVVDGAEICFDETFSADGDGIPPLKRLFGFNVEKRLTGLLRQGYSEKDALLKTFPSLLRSLENLANEKYVPPENARVTFNPDDEKTFEYVPEKTGRKANLDKLIKDVVKNVIGAQSVVSVSYDVLYPEITEKICAKTPFFAESFRRRSKEARTQESRTSGLPRKNLTVRR